MSRLFWFVLGGVATALGACVVKTIIDGEVEDESYEELVEGGQRDMDTENASDEQPESEK